METIYEGQEYDNTSAAPVETVVSEDVHEDEHPEVSPTVDEVPNITQDDPQQPANEQQETNNRTEEVSDNTTHLTESRKQHKLSWFEKNNNFVLKGDEYVDVLLRFKVDQLLYNPVTRTGIRHVFTQTKIEKKNKSGTIPVCSAPRTKTLTRMAPMVEFKREPFPSPTEYM